MFYTLENKAISEIESLNRIISSQYLIIPKNLDLRTNIKKFTVASCVTRLYAIYESFIDTIISDYLDMLSECAAFDSLSEEFKQEYRIGISTILSRLDYHKYRNLKNEDIIKWYYEAITGINPYRFVASALNRHEQNLRLNIVENLLSKIQLKDFYKWIIEHPLTKDLYEGEFKIEILESELKNFIQLRNDASHGTLDELDDLEGFANLERFFLLIKNFIRIVSSFFRSNILGYYISTNKVAEVGYVSEIFRNGACIIKARRNVLIKVKTEFYLDEKNNCTKIVLDSLQINSANFTSVKCKQDDLEIGLKFSTSVRKKSKVYITI